MYIEFRVVRLKQKQNFYFLINEVSNSLTNVCYC